MKYWYHFVYNIVGGVFKKRGRVWGRRSDTVSVEHLSRPTRAGGGGEGGEEVREREEAEEGECSRPVQPGIPLKNYLFLAGWTGAPPRRSPRLD